MKKIFFTTFTIVISAILLAGCGALGQAEPTTEAMIPVTGMNDLVEELRNQGAEVETGGAVEQPIFDAESTLLMVNGEEVQVFEFPDDSAAAQIAAAIDESATTIGGTTVSWVSTPHLYISENLIVIYVGDNMEITGMLEQIVGAQFAGG